LIRVIGPAAVLGDGHVRDVVAAPGAGAGGAVVDRHWGVVAVDRGLIRQGLGA
jgi:hypothetical protein